jgi:O-antigen/teichoic acid export membrane protein
MVNEPKSLTLKGRLKFLLRDSAIYGGASAISKLFALFTFPIMARYFSVEDYGIIDAFTILCSLLVTALVFGQDSAVARYFYEYEDTLERKKVISQSLSIQLIIILTSIPVLLFFADPISNYYTNKEGLRNLTKLVIWQVPFGLIINFAGNILKWTFKRFRFLFLQLGSGFFYVITVIIAIIFFKAGVNTVFQLFLISRIIFGIIGLIFIFGWISFKFDTNHFHSLLRFGTPYGIICIIGAFLPAMDRFFINRYLTPHDLGLYAVSYKVALLIQLPISAFQTAWGPFYLSIFKQKDAQQTYNTVLLLFTIIVSTFGLGIILFSKTLIFILAGEKYEAAYMPVFPIIMGLIMMSLGWILAIGIDLSKKSHLKFFSTITQLIVAGSSIYFLIPIYGLMGVGIGFLLGYLAYIIIETYMAYNAYHLRFDLYNPIIILSGVIALGVLSIITESESIVTQSIQGIIYLVVFLWFIWMVPLKRKNLFIVLKNIIR